MPKRSLDIGKLDPSMPSDKTQRKTERSHEENQERAYIAASRRADRSIEARVQSARMASDIHKKRTGKGFRITEEIVMKEEMYEEEEDDFPRSYRLLGPHLQTASAEMNFKVEAYLSNRVAMSALLARTNEDWRENEINRLFAQSFPNAGKQAQQLSQRMSNPEYPGQGSPTDRLPQSPVQPTFNPVNYQQGTGHHEHRRSMSYVDPTEHGHNGPASPPALTPGSASTETPRTWSNPSVACASQPPAQFDSADSAFTTELPAEAKMLMGGGALDMNSAFGQSLYGQDWPNQEQYFSPVDFMRPGIKMEGVKMEEFEPEAYPDIYSDDPMSTKWDTHVQPNHMEEPWDTFINDNVWKTEQ